MTPPTTIGKQSKLKSSTKVVEDSKVFDDHNKTQTSTDFNHNQGIKVPHFSERKNKEVINGNNQGKEDITPIFENPHDRPWHLVGMSFERWLEEDTRRFEDDIRRIQVFVSEEDRLRQEMDELDKDMLALQVRVAMFSNAVNRMTNHSRLQMQLQTFKGYFNEINFNSDPRSNDSFI